MSRERNMKWLNDRRINYRCDPINDKPTIENSLYSYYENGTHECYHLFNSKAKITTYKSLKWHFYVLYYLNPCKEGINIAFWNLEYLKKWFEFIADKENGFVTFFISDKKLNEMIKDVFKTGGEPPINKKRKIIFKDFCGLSFDQKMSIVGKLIGRSTRVSVEDIYQCMLDLNDYGKKITWSRIAGLLNCSERTIIRKINNELKKEKDILNEEI
jgi:hypothetical protein